MSDDFNNCFTQVQDRLAWSATKWEKYRDRDVIPLWIADMDFPTAPVIQQAVVNHALHGNYGYMSPPNDLATDLTDYYRSRYQWTIEPDWIVWLPGLVLGINLAVRACCGDNASAITFAPVYPPFLHAATLQGRGSVVVPLLLDDAARARGVLRYRIDFAALESALKPDTSLLLLCHPHNPVGSLFSQDELYALADFCALHDLFVCSDEVHCDLILDTQMTHVPFARLIGEQTPERLARTITLHGPGKVFNIAGLGISWAIIPDAGLRKRYRTSMQRLVPNPCGFGYTALQAALRDGEPWRQALLAHLRGARDKVSSALDDMGLMHSHPEATYITWIDCRPLSERVGNVALWFEQHGVGLSDGAEFGAPGFLRLNFATPDALLDKALARMQGALKSLDHSP